MMVNGTTCPCSDVLQDYPNFVIGSNERNALRVSCTPRVTGQCSVLTYKVSSFAMFRI